MTGLKKWRDINAVTICGKRADSSGIGSSDSYICSSDDCFFRIGYCTGNGAGRRGLRNGKESRSKQNEYGETSDEKSLEMGAGAPRGVDEILASEKSFEKSKVRAC